jgi:hypothetical protein
MTEGLVVLLSWIELMALVGVLGCLVLRRR